TAAGSQRPAPASSVSRICRSKESSLLVTQATPPCAQAVLESTPLRLVTIATRPFLAVLIANVRPAIPLPMITKSNCLIREECYQSGECGQKRRPPPRGCAVRLSGEAADRRARQSQRNQFAPAVPTRSFA